MDSPNIAQADPRVEQDALSLAGALLERLGAGDPESIARLFSESIDWLVPGDPSLPWTGRRSRRADVAQSRRRARRERHRPFPLEQPLIYVIADLLGGACAALIFLFLRLGDED